MTARISLILGKTGAHRAPLQLRLVNLFTASMTAATVRTLSAISVVSTIRLSWCAGGLSERRDEISSLW